MGIRSFVVLSGFGLLVHTACSNANEPLGTHPNRGDGGAGSGGGSGAGGNPAQDDAAVAGHPDSGASGQGGCVPEGGEDFPDEDFVDSNCDGIDGDASQAIFVASNGLDGAPGTRGAPLRTIQRAITAAMDQGKHSIYICNGQYAENLRLAGDTVSLYGGYDCASDWKRGADRALILPSTGVPLTIDGVQAPVTVAHLSLLAADAVGIGGSSVAVVALRSKGVTFSGSKLTAGKGAPGAPGTPGETAGALPQAKAANGTATATNTCYTTAVGTCTYLSGGAGCTAGASGGIGGDRSCPFTPGLTVKGGNGGIGGNCSIGIAPGSGLDGSPAAPSGSTSLTGPDGTPGAPAQAGFGSIVNGRYEGTNVGMDGAVGKPGYAGKGGDGGVSLASTDKNQYIVGGGGGQGGYPGCPGLPGHGGGGGGASIALVAQGTPISAFSSLFITAAGGIGGPSGPGGNGQPGGPGGSGAGAGLIGVWPGADGAPGGNGGRGGPGGAGAGGPSIGIAYDDVAPSLIDTTFTIGVGGPGATGASGKAADGMHGETFLIPVADGG